MAASVRYQPQPAGESRPEICDLFAFRGTAGTVLAMTVNRGTDPGGFAPGAQYCFHLDLSGDFRQDTALRVTFGDGPPGAQAVEARSTEGSRPGWRDDPGTLIAAGNTRSLIGGPGGLRLWAGHAGDPAWLHGGIAEAAARCVTLGKAFDVTYGTRWPAMNLLAYCNVQAIVIEVPDDMLAAAGIGLWATTAVRRRSGRRSGRWAAASRVALPMLGDLFPARRGTAADGSGDFSDFQPSHDDILYGQAVRDGAGRAALALGTAADPAAHGGLVARRLLPDVLCYRPGTVADFAAGNGRGLQDPAAEEVISLVLGTRVPFGIGPGSVPGALRALFPYFSAPVSPPPVL